MKKWTAVICLSLCLSPFALPPASAEAAWNRLVRSVKNLVGSPSLQDQEVVAGLKEALRLGTENSVNQVGRPGGFLNNPKIRIDLPAPLARGEKLLRYAGYSEQLEAFETSMNRAAEQAAPQARSIFLQAIGEMTLADAQKILHGGETAATDYFAAQTRPGLAEAFTPIVRRSLAEVDATSRFQNLNTTFRNLPFGENLHIDLDQYVTNGALDGLFFVLGEEERKIRRNPAARTTELLQKVFAATDN